MKLYGNGISPETCYCVCYEVHDDIERFRWLRLSSMYNIKITKENRVNCEPVTVWWTLLNVENGWATVHGSFIAGKS